MNPYFYQAEKLNAARRNLMLPHPEGEALSIAFAFRECAAAFKDLNGDVLDEDAQICVKTIAQLMDVSKVNDPASEGAFLVRARRMQAEKRRELSRCLDELAQWFSAQSNVKAVDG